MRILIDTNIFLWAAVVPKKLSRKILEVLSNPESEIFLSAASSWEIAIKYGKGRLDLPEHPKTFIEKGIAASGIIPLPIKFQDTLSVSDLPHYHKDPFDRLLITQANLNNMTLISGDKVFRKYDVELIEA